MFKIIYSTNNSYDNAKEIAKYLLESKLAACVNIISQVESFYIWNDKITSDKEYIMIIKTIDDNFIKISQIIEEMHHAECPAILSLNINQGSQKFLNWLENNCK